jgi:hypothetical protein
MTLSVDLVTEGTVLILSHPTGVKYEAQCMGVGCWHPQYEGFVLSLGTFMRDFDDCSYGCYHIQDMPESQRKLADDLNKEFLEKTSKWRYQITFDYDRLVDLMEGWWPVIVSGKIDDWNKTEGTFKGIIHTGNCD